MSGWQFWIDRGGTFADVVALAPDGELQLRKVLSTRPAAGGDPALAAVRELLSTHAGALAHSVKIGTTVTTNALLERRGARVGFLVTRGFKDALVIGQQHRPDIFALDIRRPAPLYSEVAEVDERIAADGRVVTPLDTVAAHANLHRWRAAGIDSIAICLLHGWRHSDHERVLTQLAQAAGFCSIAVSHELLAVQRLIPRANSTVCAAYLMPVLAEYVASLGTEVASLPGAPALHFMQSSGGLAAASEFRALGSLLSGPAGGLVGMAQLGDQLGFRELVGFDMGGTSTDVSLFDGALPRAWRRDIAGLELDYPQLDIHTIAAGGGSRVYWQDGRLCVGPESAGAQPGPACYGRGGPATLTDAQLVLGRVLPQSLPCVFGADGSSPADANAAFQAFTALAAQLGAVQDPVLATTAAQDIAAAALDVAVEAMAQAIRQVCAQHGVDPKSFVLFAFGGAAGQHACRVAAASGMQRVLLHPLASVLSAFGIGIADWIAIERQGCRVALDAAGIAFGESLLTNLRAASQATLSRQHASSEIDLRAIGELRLGHSETCIDVAWGPLQQMRDGFASAWRTLFGYDCRAQLAQVRIENLRVEARSRMAAANIRAPHAAPRPPSLPLRTRAWFDEWREVPVLWAADAPSRCVGPALVVSEHTSLVLENAWMLERLTDGSLLASKDTTHMRTSLESPVSAARLAVFNSLFMHVATEMGAALQRSAQSVNIKERLDYSCAVFDSEGRLIANAPHMPVHLGSMGASVRAVIARHRGTLGRGDAWLINSPYEGGTHLPDLTVVSPVFLSDPPTPPDFFVASRAHHADVGGMTPGSMPPFSRHIDDEGVLFRDFALLRAGALQSAALRAALQAGPHPVRNLTQNLADLDAQLAANARGAAELRRAAMRYGAATLHSAMAEVLANAADCVRQLLPRLQSGTAQVSLDNGCTIAVRVDIDAVRRSAHIDFSGTSPQGAHNFHAPRAVCVAAVLYVIRCLLDRDIPLNEGCLQPLTLEIPPGSILDPRAPAAVVAGNVETSQCIVDALFAALGRLAGSQGTMNNLTFGNQLWQYYETIAGGAGASAEHAGCDAVQTHMTNSRLTDPEVLEDRFPVRVLEFVRRSGSGGVGKHRGGAGAIRRLEFLAAVQGAMLANRRSTVAHGLAGGGPGAAGITRLIRRDGRVQEFPACADFDLEPGDVLEILTPGGGGYGPPNDVASAS